MPYQVQDDKCPYSPRLSLYTPLDATSEQSPFHESDIIFFLDHYVQLQKSCPSLLFRSLCCTAEQLPFPVSENIFFLLDHYVVLQNSHPSLCLISFFS